jgi:hypothetical protein
MGMFGDFSKSEKKKKKKSDVQIKISSAPVFKPPTVAPKGKEKY